MPQGIAAACAKVGAELHNEPEVLRVDTVFAKCLQMAGAAANQRLARAATTGTTALPTGIQHYNAS